MSVQPALTLQQQQSQPPPPSSQQQPDSNANLIGGASNINSSSSSQTSGGLFLQPTLGQVQTQPQSYYIVQQQSSSSSAINQPSQMTVLKQPTVIFNQQQAQQQQQQQTVTNYQIVQPQSQTQPQQQMMSNGQTMIIQPNIKYVSNGQLIQQQPQQQSQQQPQSPRIIMQHPQQQTTYIMPQTQSSQQQQAQQQQQINGGGGNQFYLNINNRIVPIQSLNIKPTSSVNIQPSIQQQQQPQQQQQQTQQQQQYFIVSNNNAANSQSGVQLNQVVANTQNNSTQIQGVIQSPTIITNKPTTTTTTTTSNPVTSTLITSSGTTTTTNSITNNSSSVGVEIAEKMKQLEQVQSQLRQFQTKIVSQLNLNNGEQQPQQLVLTQQQIQSVLSPAEQSTLARLIQQKKQFEAEVQTLKHKLLMSSSSTSLSSSSSSSLAVNSTTNLDTQSNSSSSQPMSKMQLLQQVTLKLNQLRASKTVTNGTTSDGSQPQQQLVLTAEEFEQMKRLVELQSRLHAEIQQQQQQESTTNTTTTTTTPQTQTIKLNELNLAEKLKLNELIKNQLEQIKQALTQLAANNNPEQSALVAQQQQQLKDKYVVLLKKQGELQALIQQQQQQQTQKICGQNILIQTSSESPTYQILVNGNKPSQQQLTPTTTPNKQTPVKIRNVISSSSPLSTTTTTTTTGQPLRTLVLNANTNIVTTPSSNGLLVPQQQLIYPLSYAQNLQKLPQFASVQFKRLSFVELAQHGVITKNTDELAMLIIKQLDERAASLIGPEASSEQADAFAKNQVRLVKKYLEQQLAVRHAVRTRIHEQLVKDQKLALEPDYKTPFVDKTDAIKRLSRFHVFQKTLYEPTEEDGKKFDECFEQVSDRLLKTANAMKKRFHLFQLRSMQKDVAPSEETMMLRLLVDDLKASQEEVKQQQPQQPQPQPQLQPQAQSNPHPQKAPTNESINNDFVILNSTNLGLKRPLNEHNNNNDTSSSVTSNTNGIDHESSMVKKIARLEPNAAVATPKSDANSTDKVEFDLGDEDEENSNSLKNSKQLIASNAATTNNSDLFSLSDYNTETSESNAKINASTVTLPPSNSNHLDLVNQPPSTNNFINYDFNDVQAPNRTASNTNTMINPTTTTAEEDEDANVMNNLSGLDDLILNEDELAVNCDSMFD